MKNLFLIFYFIFNFFNYAQGYICAIGGGAENYNDWSDKPYSWIVEKSDSGKIIILGVSSATDWLPNYFIYFGADTAYNKTINSRSIADQQATYDELISAQAIFIRGGDQWDYINYWKGTKTEAAIKYVYQNGGVVAGTSAGAMILSEFIFSAKNGSAYPDECLLNPNNYYVTIENNFLKLFPNVLFDTHFIQRGRFGRLIAFMLKIYNSFSRNILGVGIDDMTAICIDTNKIGTIFGSGAVSIFQIDHKTRINPDVNNYTFENLKCDQLVEGWTFDFNTNSIYSVPPSAKQIDSTQTLTSPITNLWLTGKNELVSSNLQSFLNSANTNVIGIVYNSDYESSTTTLKNYLSSNSYYYISIPISTTNLEQPDIANKIDTSTTYIILGNKLHIINLLADTTKLAGQKFNNKIKYSVQDVYLIGTAGKLSGSFLIDYTDTYSSASFEGRFIIRNGLNLFQDLIFQPLLFDNSDYYENRTSAVTWGMMRNRKRVGLHLDNEQFAKFSKNENSIVVDGAMPIMLIDARGTTFVDSSKYKKSGAPGTRCVVGMNNLRYHISKSERKYSINDGLLQSLTEIENNQNINLKFHLYDNYPNPFNPKTVISYQIPVTSKVQLKIYNILGQEITTLVNKEQLPGIYEVEFDAVNLSSGVYFYQLQFNDKIETKKMLFLK